MQKTLAMKLLEGKKIAYEPYEYPKTERDAAVIAQIFGVPASQVYKTLVVDRPPAKPLLIMVAADRRLNLKKLAKVTGDKKLSMASHAEAERLTNLKVGGISPLLLINKGFKIYIDDQAKNQQEIFVSAGQKGINLKVKVQDLLKITKARPVAVSDSTLEE